MHTAINCSPYYAAFGMSMVQHGASYELYRKLGSVATGDFETVSGPDRMQLLRDKILRELKLAHERSTKVYNTRSRDVKFKLGQIVYRRNFKQSSQIDNYNAKLAPKQVKCIVLNVIGNSMYELGDVNGKKIGTYHAKDIFAG